MKQGGYEAIRSSLALYFVMGSPNCLQAPERVLQEAIAGGITLFQFREKGKGALSGSAKFELAARLKDICDQNQIPFIIDDDVELALKLDAAGIHIGQEDAPLEEVRASCRDKLVGVSVHTVQEAELAIAQGADYLGLGPIFPTLTKKDAKPVQGTVLIEQLRSKGYTIPIVGIGGVTADNVDQVMKAGADGAAVITAISHAEHVQEAARMLKEIIIKKGL